MLYSGLSGNRGFLSMVCRASLWLCQILHYYTTLKALRRPWGMLSPILTNGIRQNTSAAKITEAEKVADFDHFQKSIKHGTDLIMPSVSLLLSQNPCFINSEVAYNSYSRAPVRYRSSKLQTDSKGLLSLLTNPLVASDSYAAHLSCNQRIGSIDAHCLCCCCPSPRSCRRGSVAWPSGLPPILRMPYRWKTRFENMWPRDCLPRKDKCLWLRTPGG